MKKKAIFILLVYIFFAFIITPSYAQLFNPIRKSIDVGFAGDNKLSNVGFQYNQYLKLNRKGIFQVGWGIRSSHLRANTLDYTTAPSALTKGKSGLAPNAPNIDTLQIRTAITSFNFNIGFQLSFFNRFDLGVNADLLGLALGARRSGFHLGSAGYNKADSLNLHQTFQQARPRGLSILLPNDHVKGTLNSELFIRLRFSEKIALKAGYLWAVSEYQTDKLLVNDNRRFRFRSKMLSLGLSFPVNQ
ncbi:hypothetical protein [Runella slithyformis]|uniref:Outer membrane protein beta-barrel domain-containing protein n=1 Tax=Runella slithyformis (strain ATCC 29530 / DSM 19594 / LMG 11500 / NCIMB 11436 / LSU 4) TaxID=761193 RepID=A0A7U3ZNG6_RUNSL|nr:hypothetical protein [Runella slithyformis]AEI50455.1 hypothetical protein Runsl_4108 [Runella slithyformis DSM 19594]